MRSTSIFSHASLAVAAMSLASAAEVQTKPALQSPPAQQEKVEFDQLAVRMDDDSVQSLAGWVTADGLTQVTLLIAGKETKLASVDVLKVTWGNAPRSYMDALASLNRGQFAAATEQFRRAAEDSSARQVVRASARLEAAQALLRWGAIDPMRLAEAHTEAQRFQRECADSRGVARADLIEARAAWMSGQANEAAQVYGWVFDTWALEEVLPGFRCEDCLESGCNAARALLDIQPPDTQAARGLYVRVSQAAVYELELHALPFDISQVTRIRDEANQGSEFVDLAEGKQAVARKLFEGRLEAQSSISETTKCCATLGLALALQAGGKLREAQFQFAKVSALEFIDRDRAARAQVGLAETTLQLGDSDAKPQARNLLEDVVKTQGDTLSAAKARELLAKL